MIGAAVGGGLPAGANADPVTGRLIGNATQCSSDGQFVTGTSEVDVGDTGEPSVPEVGTFLCWDMTGTFTLDGPILVMSAGGTCTVNGQSEVLFFQFAGVLEQVEYAGSYVLST